MAEMQQQMNTLNVTVAHSNGSNSGSGGSGGSGGTRAYENWTPKLIRVSISPSGAHDASPTTSAAADTLLTKLEAGVQDNLRCNIAWKSATQRMNKGGMAHTVLLYRAADVEHSGAKLEEIANSMGGILAAGSNTQNALAKKEPHPARAARTRSLVTAAKEVVYFLCNKMDDADAQTVTLQWVPTAHIAVNGAAACTMLPEGQAWLGAPNGQFLASVMQQKSRRSMRMQLQDPSNSVRV